MKRLMIGLVGALAMVAGAEVKSSNTVGFQNASSIADNNFIAVPFNTVGYNTADIQQIRISDDGSGIVGWGGETFSIWEGVPTVADGSFFFYWDASMDLSGEATAPYWSADGGMTKAEFSIAPGQGVVLGLTDGLKISYEGEVLTQDIEFESIDGNNFAGNNFASSIDIQSISIDDEGAGIVGWGGETFSIWEGVPTVTDGSFFFYWDASMDLSGEATAPYWSADGGMTKAAYPIPAGQGFVLGLQAGLKVTVAAPY